MGGLHKLGLITGYSSLFTAGQPAPLKLPIAWTGIDCI